MYTSSRAYMYILENILYIYIYIYIIIYIYIYIGMCIYIYSIRIWPAWPSEQRKEPRGRSQCIVVSQQSVNDTCMHISISISISISIGIVVLNYYLTLHYCLITQLLSYMLQLHHLQTTIFGTDGPSPRSRTLYTMYYVTTLVQYIVYNRVQSIEYRVQYSIVQYSIVIYYTTSIYIYTHTRIYT